MDDAEPKTESELVRSVFCGGNGNSDIYADKSWSRFVTKNGLFASQHYFPLNRVFDSNLCPNWENAFKSILNLFNDKRFTTEQAEKCCEIVNKYAKAINN